jgi:hypothetical protein
LLMPAPGMSPGGSPDVVSVPLVGAVVLSSGAAEPVSVVAATLVFGATLEVPPLLPVGAVLVAPVPPVVPGATPADVVAPVVPELVVAVDEVPTPLLPVAGATLVLTPAPEPGLTGVPSGPGSFAPHATTPNETALRTRTSESTAPKPTLENVNITQR